MSMQQLHTELLNIFSSGPQNQMTIIKRLDHLIDKFGIQKIKKWRNFSNKKKNPILHELVEMNLPEVVRHFLLKCQYDINTKRESDNKTAYQLADQNGSSQMCDLLKNLGADDTTGDDDSEESTEEDKMNIVWVDLEMTSLEDPEIIECAVIITDKDLTELDRRNWIIHFDKFELDKLGEWHQDNFKSEKEGGNNLFHDSIKSNFTKEQVENEFLTLLKRYCPEKQCSLAGSSIHIDKGVLQRCMPTVHDYLHYRIIDVTSFQAIMRRWTPWIESKIKKQIARDDVKHRAMDDIEWSLAFMRRFRPYLGQNQRKPERSVVVHQRSASAGGPVRRINRDDNKLQLYADEKHLLERIKNESKVDLKILNLSSKDQAIYDQNPHLREVFLNHEQLITNGGEFTIHNRLFSPAPNNGLSMNKVNPRKFSTIEHWGQRKLLLMEMEFLTYYANQPSSLVIYAGAAPGSYINYLSLLFPQLTFILFDTNEFSVKENEKIKLKRENFTSEIAMHYSKFNRDILFICNVHTYNTQDNVLNDMDKQMEWLHLLKPRASFLNFRFPRTSKKFRYLDGKLIIQPWASKQAIECRLVVEGITRMADYDSNFYEDAMIYFNNVTRIMYYKHNMDEIETEGLDHCYDCTAEIFILQQYLRKMKKIENELDLKKQTAKLSYEISRAIQDKTRPKITDSIRTLNVISKK